MRLTERRRGLIPQVRHYIKERLVICNRPKEDTDGPARLTTDEKRTESISMFYQIQLK